jgi:hypothetical protein
MANDTVDTAIATTRAKLGSTLDAIEDKFNVKKQSTALVERTKTQGSALVERTRSSYESNPIPWIAGATAAALVIAGVVAWALFSGDDD